MNVLSKKWMKKNGFVKNVEVFSCKDYPQLFKALENFPVWDGKSEFKLPDLSKRKEVIQMAKCMPKGKGGKKK